ncbi:DUF1798 domain-containing protein [Sesbania bispinosa]|nr:DUF1798 domain-containing protein [Sesbania bispinosa]
MNVFSVRSENPSLRSRVQSSNGGGLCFWQALCADTVRDEASDYALLRLSNPPSHPDHRRALLEKGEGSTTPFFSFCSCWSAAEEVQKRHRDGAMVGHPSQAPSKNFKG